MTTYPLRRATRELNSAEAEKILNDGEYCVISSIDEDGTPYGVPLSYVILDDKLYVHTAIASGHKFDDWERDARVCVTVVTDVQAFHQENNFSTTYTSVIATGTIRKNEDAVLKKKTLVALCMKYLPEYKNDIAPAMEQWGSNTDIWEVTFAEICAKGNKRN